MTTDCWWHWTQTDDPRITLLAIGGVLLAVRTSPKLMVGMLEE